VDRVDLSRDLLGQRFQNPLLLAAGTAGFGRELDGVLDLDRLGGLVTKAVSVEPRSGNPAPRVGEFPGGMLNSVGLANPGVEQVRNDYLPWLAKRVTRARVLVNVIGFTVEEYGEVVGRLEGVPGITAFELNLSCPNTSAGGAEFGADAGCVRRIVAACRSRTRLPLVAKLSPVLPDIAAMALVARDAGADAVSAVNTIPGLLFGNNGKARLGQGYGGVSGPALLPVGVLAVSRIVERTEGMPVIGAGGVRSAGDVRHYLRAGASLVAIGTGALADPHLPERIIRELERDSGV
jgi:dihydroorotate dehydrogenase (NAD+) catalytic subunit